MCVYVSVCAYASMYMHVHVCIYVCACVYFWASLSPWDQEGKVVVLHSSFLSLTRAHQCFLLFRITSDKLYPRGESAQFPSCFSGGRSPHQCVLSDQTNSTLKGRSQEFLVVSPPHLRHYWAYDFGKASWLLAFSFFTSREKGKCWSKFLLPLCTRVECAWFRPFSLNRHISDVCVLCGLCVFVLSIYMWSMCMCYVCICGLYVYVLCVYICYVCVMCVL